MKERILITGGAGFIGCHLCSALLHAGYQVRVLDDLVEQVHAGQKLHPILRETELIVGSVRNLELVSQTLSGVDAVVHLAAEVGVGQSMYEIDRYVGANDLGTAALLQALLTNPVRRVVVASSMSIYGEAFIRRLTAGRSKTLCEAGGPLRDGIRLTRAERPSPRYPHQSGSDRRSLRCTQSRNSCRSGWS